MALLFATGFEGGSTRVCNVDGSGSTTGTTHGSWSTYAYNDNAVGNLCFSVSPVTEFYYGMAVYWVNTPTNGRIFCWFQSPSGTDQIRLVTAAGQYLAVQRGGTTIGTGTQILQTSHWYYIEVHGVIHDTTGSVEVRIDGVTDISLSGIDTRNDATYATVDRVRFGSDGNSLQKYIDDIYFCDTTGGVNDTWLGDIQVPGLSPTAAGDHTALSRGGTDSGANWSQVDEKPPNDATDYVYGSTVDTYDLYGLGNTVTTGTVHGLVCWTWAAKDDAGFGKIANVLKYDTDASGTADTEYTGGDHALSTTWDYYRDVYDQQPDSTAWTTAKLDALQVGVKVR